ncbi:DUF2380 domain-containing protein [uncultured Jannaschia sp.]|uniref:DUF2380 domain-containing protein n=1 Tax=uncultured Jannaschia sp. TaxID=293347 RepID=UPI00262F6E00|nr:DUF2380 domain-containing protein [uncultured Jannaschia sp.]
MPRPLLALIALLLCIAAGARAQERHLLIMEPEIEGDTSPLGQAGYAERLDRTSDFITASLAGVYAIVPAARADVSLAKHRRRAKVHMCAPCAMESGREAGADRTLQVWVFRMSALVLSMQAVLRDVETGEVRYATAHDFRGDTEAAWRHAANRLVAGIAAIPPKDR